VCAKIESFPLNKEFRFHPKLIGVPSDPMTVLGHQAKSLVAAKLGIAFPAAGGK
jgi:hypothetical protein